MKSKKNIILRRTTTVPVFDFSVILLVAKDVRLALNSVILRKEELLPASMHYEGMCLAKGNTVVVAYQADLLAHGLVAHEIFHATHRIMDARSISFSMDHQEPFAYVAEFLHTWVYAQLKKAKVRVR